MMHIYYRISDRGYPKQKPAYVTPENCIRNFISNFCNGDTSELTIIADNCGDETVSMIRRVTGLDPIRTSLGNAGSFRFLLDEALKLEDDTIIYSVEQDYLHRKGSRQALLEGLEIADYVSLYDHIDKYMQQNLRPEYILRTNTTHWRTCISTTMTFAAKVGTLRKCESSIRKWTSGAHPDDHRMFCELGSAGYTLISALPAFCSHGETAFLSPGVDWEKEL